MHGGWDPRGHGPIIVSALSTEYGGKWARPKYAIRSNDGNTLLLRLAGLCSQESFKNKRLEKFAEGDRGSLKAHPHRTLLLTSWKVSCWQLNRPGVLGSQDI